VRTLLSVWNRVHDAIHGTANSPLLHNEIREVELDSQGNLWINNTNPQNQSAALFKFNGATWQMFAVPAGTPRPIVDKLHAEIGAVIAMPEVYDEFVKAGRLPAKQRSVEDMSAYIKSELVRWTMGSGSNSATSPLPNPKLPRCCWTKVIALSITFRGSAGAAAAATLSASAKLAAVGLGNFELGTADALQLDLEGRFDAIAVTGSMPALEDRFVRMLRPEGRLFVVVGRLPVMEARLITLLPTGSTISQSLFETVLSPLINAERPEPFVL